MKRTLKILTSFLLMIAIFLVFQNKVFAATPIIEFSLKIGNKTEITKELIEQNLKEKTIAVDTVRTKVTYFEVELYGRSIVDEYLEIGGIQFLFNASDTLLGITGVTAESGWNDYSTPYSKAIKEYKIGLGRQDITYIENYDTLIGKINIVYNKESTAADYYIALSYFGELPKEPNGTTGSYVENDIIFKNITVGNPSSDPITTLKDFTATDSTNKALNVAKSSDDKTYTVTNDGTKSIPYAIAKNGITLKPVPTSNKAKVTITPNGGTSTEVPLNGSYNTGKLEKDTTYIMSVEDNGVTDDYTIIVKVVPPLDEVENIDLELSNATLTGTFNAATLKYTVTVPFSNPTTTFKLTGLDERLTVAYDAVPTNGFKNGDKYNIKVTTETGREVTYEFTVNIANASTDAGLKHIEIDDKIISSSTLNYNFTQDKGDSFTFTVVAKDLAATISIDGATTDTKTDNIAKGGSKKYTIKIKAENGFETTYTFTVTRDKSNVAELDTVIITDGGADKPISNFEKDNSYTLKGDESKSFGFKLTTKENGTYKIYKVNGSNKTEVTNQVFTNEQINNNDRFEIEVTAANGTTKNSYYFTIVKKSSDNKIDLIQVRDDQAVLISEYGKTSKYELFFDDALNTYSLSLPYNFGSKIEVAINSANLSVIAIESKNPNTLNLNLISNSKNKASLVHTFSNNANDEEVSFQLSVAADNGDVASYTFKFKREKADNEKKLQEFEINGETVKNFNNTTEGGTYETIYIEPTDLTQKDFSLSIRALAKSLNARVQILVDNTIAFDPKANEVNTSYTIKRGQTYKITIKVYAQSSTNNNEVVNQYTVDVLFASNSVDVTDITLDGIVLTKNSSNQFLYEGKTTFLVSKTKINLTLLSNTNAKVESLTGGVTDIRSEWELNNISPTKNTRSFKIVSESGQKSQTYTIEVIRESGRTHKDLKTLRIETSGGYVYEFSNLSSQTTYDLKFDDSTNGKENNKFILYATIEENKGATFEKGSNLITKEVSGDVTSGGKTTATISVYDENGTLKEYKINIHRANTNKEFKGVIVESVDYDISKFVDNTSSFGGKLKLDDQVYKQKTLNLSFSGLDSKASIEILEGDLVTKTNGYTWNLATGSNIIKFRIVAQDGTKSLEYIIEVNRLTAKTDNLLYDLEIKLDGQTPADGKKNNIAFGQGFEWVVGRDIQNVLVIVRVKIVNKSTVLNFGNATVDGEYHVYQRTFSGNQIDSAIRIEVKAEDDDVDNNIHELKVVRKSKNNIINDISISIDNKFKFSENTTYPYIIKVRHNSPAFSFLITKEDIYAKLLINGSNLITDKVQVHTYSVDVSKLSEGNNIISFKLESEYDTGKYGDEYTFNVYVEPKKSDKVLYNLEVIVNESNKLENFKSGTTSYPEIRFNNDVKSAKVYAYVLKDYYATIDGFTRGEEVTIDNKIYVKWEKTETFGSRKEFDITVKVVAENGTSEEYIVPIVVKNDSHDITKVVVTINGVSTTYQGEELKSLIKLQDVLFAVETIKFQITRSDKNASVYYNDQLQTGNNATAEYVLDVALKENVVNNIKFSLKSEYGNDGEPVNFEIFRAEANNDSRLSELTITHQGANIFASDQFKPNSNRYAFLISDLESNEVIINAKSNILSNLEVTFDGNTTKGSPKNVVKDKTIYLNRGTEGKNIIVVKVTAENGSTFEYTIVIYYANNNYELDKTEMIVSDNEINNELIVFDGNALFTKSVAWNFGTKINLDFKTKDEFSKIVVTRNGVTANINSLDLLPGVNTYVVTVKSNYSLLEDTNYRVEGITVKEKSYTLRITKAAAKTDTKLESLKVIDSSTGKVIAFDGRAFDKNDDTNKTYNIKLQDIVNGIKIEAVGKNHQKISYDFDETGITLSYDAEGKLNETYTIFVEAEGTDGEYKINVTKGIDLSDDATVSGIDVYDFLDKEKKTSLVMFKDQVMQDSIEVSYKVSDIVFNVKKNNENAVVEINGILYSANLPISLDINENKIEVVITSQDGQKTKKYEYTITRKEASNEIGVESLVIKNPNSATPVYNLSNEDISKLNTDGTLTLYVGVVQTTTISTDVVLKDLNAAIAGLQNSYSIAAGKETKVIFVVTAENGKDNKTYTINIIPGSSDASINDDTLIVNIDGKTYTKNDFTIVDGKYTLKTKVSYKTNKAIVSFTANNSNAKPNRVDKDEVSLIDGTTSFTYEIVAENGKDTKTIEFIIEKEEPDTDNKLKSLTVNEYSYEGEFNEDTNNYTIKLPLKSDITKLTVNAVAVSDKAVIKDFVNGVRVFELKKNSAGLIIEKLQIEVVAEDGEVNTYVIDVIQANTEEKSGDTSLKEEVKIIGENGEEYVLKPEENTKDNPLVIDPKDSYIRIIDPTNDSDAKIDKDFFNKLEPGKVTPIEFEVTAPDGTKESKVIYIERPAQDDSNILESLVVKNGEEILAFDNGSFDPLNKKYSIKLPITSTIKNVNVIATLPNGSKATLTGDGAYTLIEKNGEIFERISVTVTSESGKSNTYLIDIIKSNSGDLSDDNSVKSIIIKGLTTKKEYTYIIGNISPVLIDGKDENVIIIVNTNNSKAIIEGELTYSLVAGIEVIASITVYSESRINEETYNIPMLREELADDAKLETLLINNKNIELQDGIFEYVVEVDETINQIKMDGTLSFGAKSNVKFPFADNFLNNERIIPIVVTAEDGETTNTYIVRIVKKNNNFDLESIKIDGNERITDFNSLKLELEDRLYKDSKISLSASSLSDKARVTIKVNGKSLTGLKEVSLDTELAVGDNVIEIYATSELNVESDKYVININRASASDNALLDNLVIKAVDGEPYKINFNPNINKYIIEVKDIANLDAVEIIATKGDEYQRVEGDGIQELSFSTIGGVVTVILKVKVIAESGKENIYEITIAREVKPEKDISVTELKLIGSDAINYLGTETSALNSFSSAVKTYEITVPYAVTYLNLNVINKNGAEVIYLLNGNKVNGIYYLTEKETLINFYLVSQDGSENNIESPYIIKVTKDDANDDNTLSEITIDGKLIEGFDPEILNYEIIVDANKVKKILLGAKANNELAKVEGTGTRNVVKGTNTFNIKVIAEDKSERIYTVTVKSLSNNNGIINIEVQDHELDKIFAPDIDTYQLIVEYDVPSINIIVTADEGAVISGGGYKVLQIGRNLYNIYATSESGVRGIIYQVEVIRKNISSDSSLKSLIITDGATGIEIPFNPTFRPTTTNYVINLDKDSKTNSIFIDAIANNEYAKVGGIGFNNLEAKVEGEYHNVFNVIVRAQDGTTTTYTIKVYRGVTLDDNNSIGELSLVGSDGVNYLGTNNAKMVFNPATKKYEVIVPYIVNSVNLVVKSSNGLADVIGDGTKQFGALNEISFEVYLVSLSGVESDSYEIVVKRIAPITDNELVSITYNGIPIPGFDPAKTQYEISIPYNSTDGKINLAALAKNTNTKIQGDLGNLTLKKGKNVFNIVAQSEDGKTNTYTIIVHHSDANALLQDLIIKGKDGSFYSLKFEPNRFEYTIVLNKGDDTIDISATAQDPAAGIFGATKKVISSSNDKFEVLVIAEDGVTRNTYIIRTSRDYIPSNNTRLKTLTIANHQFNFSGDLRNYNLNANKNEKQLSIDAIAEDQNAKVEIVGADNISEGRNTILIKVTAENGDYDYYQIDVTKDAAPDYLFLILLIMTFLLWLITILVIILKRQREKNKEQDEVIY